MGELRVYSGCFTWKPSCRHKNERESHMATTISVSEDTKEKLKNFGKAGDSYEDVIIKMYEFTRRNVLLSCLYDESDSISLEEARKRI